MKLTIKRVILMFGLLLIAFFVIGLVRNWEKIQRVYLGGVKVYETTPPELPKDLRSPAILVFSKTNGFRHEEAIPAANALFETFARDNGWGYFQTENSATFNPEILSRFDAVVFNNVSGDVFTPDQRKALKNYIENGGGFVGFHGSGGDMTYKWQWYVDKLIGAQFIGHTMDPQFPDATLRIEDKSHPATAGLPDDWARTEEWYSFEKSPRLKNYHILATLDESTYKPRGLFGQDIAMGEDHPMIWWHCEGRGRVFYSALGHRASAYSEPEYRQILLGATRWALGREGEGCGESPKAAADPEEQANEK